MTVQRPTARRWTAFGASATASLLLSPITAIFALLIGPLGYLITADAHGFRTVTTPMAVFAGITTGAIPYLAAGLLL